MKKFIFLSLSLLLFAPIISAQMNKRWADVKAGKYAIGFKTVLKFNQARTTREKTDINGKPFTGIRFRPIQMSIWYPAVKSAKPMKFEDYLYVTPNFQREASGRTLTAEEKLNIVRGFKQTRVNGGADTKAIEEYLSAELPVFQNAAAVEGKFPLVLMMSGAYTLDNTELCEFLASHGYVAVHLPSVVPTLDYVADYEFAINYLAENSNADSSRIGAVGFSYGGLAATMFHLKNRSLDAIVSLDGVEGWKRGADEILASPHYNVRNANVPYLRFHNPKQDEQAAAPTTKLDRRFYDAIRYADIMQIDFDNVTHIDFLSSAVTRANIPNFAPNSAKADVSVSSKHKLLQIYTLNFLNANVKNEAESRTFLQNTPEQNGFAKESAAYNLKKGIASPPSAAQISSEIAGKDGVFSVKRVFDDMKKRGEPLTGMFTENQMNAWGYELLGQNRLVEAIAVFQINVEFFPNSANALDSLGEGFENNGQLKESAENYEKAHKMAEKNGETQLAQTSKTNFERVSVKLK